VNFGFLLFDSVIHPTEVNCHAFFAGLSRKLGFLLILKGFHVGLISVSLICVDFVFFVLDVNC